MSLSDTIERLNDWYRDLSLAIQKCVFGIREDVEAMEATDSLPNQILLQYASQISSASSFCSPALITPLAFTLVAIQKRLDLNISRVFWEHALRAHFRAARNFPSLGEHRLSLPSLEQIFHDEFIAALKNAGVLEGPPLILTDENREQSLRNAFATGVQWLFAMARAFGPDDPEARLEESPKGMLRWLKRVIESVQ